MIDSAAQHRITNTKVSAKPEKERMRTPQNAREIISFSLSEVTMCVPRPQQVNGKIR